MDGNFGGNPMAIPSIMINDVLYEGDPEVCHRIQHLLQPRSTAGRGGGRGGRMRMLRQSTIVDEKRNNDNDDGDDDDDDDLRGEPPSYSAILSSSDDDEAMPLVEQQQQQQQQQPPKNSFHSPSGQMNDDDGTNNENNNDDSFLDLEDLDEELEGVLALHPAENQRAASANFDDKILYFSTPSFMDDDDDSDEEMLESAETSFSKSQSFVDDAVLSSQPHHSAICNPPSIPLTLSDSGCICLSSTGSICNDCLASQQPLPPHCHQEQEQQEQEHRQQQQLSQLNSATISAPPPPTVSSPSPTPLPKSSPSPPPFTQLPPFTPPSPPFTPLAVQLPPSQRPRRGSLSRLKRVVDDSSDDDSRINYTNSLDKY